METYFEQASLVFEPGVYEANKVYVVKPEGGAGDLTFSRNSTATRVNQEGLIESVGANVPRLDYTDSTCPKLQLEPQRSNLAVASADLTNVIYAKANATITSNSETAPDGTLTADTITATSAFGQVQGAVVITSGIVYTMSVWLKRKTGTGQVYLRGVSNTSTPITITSDWVRYSVSLNAADTSGRYGVLLSTSGDEVYAWGFQLEAGAYPTSYIPTTTAAVTRLADACSKTGISSLIGQTEGTIFFECSNKALLVNARYFSVSDGTGSNRIDIYQAGATNLGIFVGAGGAAQVNVTNVALPASGAFKFALAYANNDYVWYVNGTQVATDTSASVPATSAALLGVAADLTASAGNAPFSQALLFKTRLTNQQLAELTEL